MGQAAIEIGIDLARFTVLQSSRSDEIEEGVAHHLRPHTMLAHSQEPLDCLMQFVPIGGVSLGRLRYGGRVAIQSDPLHACYVASVPLAGSAVYRQGGQETVVVAHSLCVLGPREPFSIELDAAYDQLLLRIDAAAFERVHTSLTADGAVPVVALGLGGSAAQSACALPVLQMLLANNQLLDQLRLSPRLATHVEWLLITSLLHAAAPDAATLSDGESSSAAVVRRAEDYIHEHFAAAISVVDIAEAVGTSSRTLFTSFKKHRGQPPMRLVRQLRLERVHEELLLSAPEAATVTEIAMRWGFGHLGEFSRAYGERFGERPSQTLHRATFR